MAETVTLTREELEQLIDQRVAQGVRRGTANTGPVSDDPLMAEAAGQALRSHPDPPKSQMEQLAKQRGGLWSPDNLEWRKYGGVIQGRDGRLRTIDHCPHAKPKQCDKCWTPETEGRWAYTLGLSDDIPVPLDDREEPGSQQGGEITRRMERGPGGRPRRAADTREPAHS